MTPGPVTPGGGSPILSAWAIPGFPTTVVIDSLAVVRAFKSYNREAMEKVLGELVAEPAQP